MGGPCTLRVLPAGSRANERGLRDWANKTVVRVGQNSLRDITNVCNTIVIQLKSRPIVDVGEPHSTAMTLAAWTPQVCEAIRDCHCCGANAALACLEGPDHSGIHAFICRNCGRDKDC